MNKKVKKKIMTLALAAMLTAVSVMPAKAASEDVIDTSKTASLTIHKYDITAATQAGVNVDDQISTGKQNSEEEKTQQDEYPQEESELSDIKCEICDMRTEVKEQIKNYAAFENAIKNWMLMNGYTNEKIISRNDVTTQYDSGKKLYWMILEKGNKSFYVVEDMQSGTCKTIDKK